MRRRFLALLLPALLPSLGALAAEDLGPPNPLGTWRAELERSTGPGVRPQSLVLRVRQGKDGLGATLEGLGTKPHGVAVANLILVEDVLSFQVPEVAGRFAGNIYGDSVRGIWSEGEQSWPLIFYRD